MKPVALFTTASPMTLHPLARQIRIASRLAPAEAFRGRSGLLLACGPSPALAAAEDALREAQRLDEVRSLLLPLRSWAAALAAAPPDAPSWLRGHLLREIDRHPPHVLGLLVEDDGDPGRSEKAAMQLVAMLRSWDVDLPVVGVRVRGDGARGGLADGTAWLAPDPSRRLAADA